MNLKRYLSLLLVLMLLIGIVPTVYAAEPDTGSAAQEDTTEPTEPTDPPGEPILSAPAALRAAGDYAVMSIASTQNSIMLFDYADNGNYTTVLNSQVACAYKPNGSGTTRTAYIKNLGWHFARYGGVAYPDDPLYCIEPWRSYGASTSGNSVDRGVTLDGSGSTTGSNVWYALPAARREAIGLILLYSNQMWDKSVSVTTIKGAALNVLKGFFACALIGVAPVELYKFCVSLQNSFAGDLTRIFSGAQGSTIGEIAAFILRTVFTLGTPTEPILKLLFFLLSFSYCAIKVFFANIKRGGILLIQIAVGSLYMFSVPRGYTDGFNQWCKQIMAICLTAFLQTTLLFLGMLTLQDNLLLGLGIMLTANEVPRIAQQFGLDSSVRVNVSSVVYSTSSAVNLAKNLMRK